MYDLSHKLWLRVISVKLVERVQIPDAVRNGAEVADGPLADKLTMLHLLASEYLFKQARNIRGYNDEVDNVVRCVLKPSKPLDFRG